MARIWIGAREWRPVGPLRLTPEAAAHLDNAGLVLLRIENRTAATLRVRGVLLPPDARAAARWQVCAVLRQRLFALLT